MEVLLSRDMAMDQRLYIPVTMVTDYMAKAISNVFMELGREGPLCANVSKHS